MRSVQATPAISDEASGPFCAVKRLCEALGDPRHDVTLAALDWALIPPPLAYDRCAASRIYVPPDTLARLLPKWPQAGGLTRIDPRPLSTDRTKPRDAYHPTGSSRMGVDAQAVVGRDLRLASLDNAWVAGTAVLPGAGTANPTFTLLCLANRLARTLPTDG